MLHGCYPVGGLDHLDSVMILHAGWPVMRSAAVILTFHGMDDGCTIPIILILNLSPSLMNLPSDSEDSD